MMDIQEICSSFARQKNQLIERNLVGAIEQIEGRVPTNAEVMQHGKRNIFPDGREEWCWKGQPIIRIATCPTRMDGDKFVFEIQRVFKETPLP